MAHPSKILSGRTVLISGGGGAISAASAQKFLEDGAAVLLMDMRADNLEAVRGGLRSAVPGARVETFVGDALAPRDVDAALQAAFEIQDRLDVVLSTVGGGMVRPLLLHDLETFSAEIGLNLNSAFLALRYGVPKMSPGGAIVLLSSTAARSVTPWMAAYSIGKASVDALVRSAAEELGAAGIRVNAVRPGLTRSRMTAPTFRHAKTLAATLEQIPLGRTGEPEDIAAAIRYLGGPESSWVTGQSLAVDGGGELRKNPDLGPSVAHFYGEETFAAVKRGKLP